MRLPLLARWRLFADGLAPADGAIAKEAFFLPGADELADFADLLGGEADDAAPQAQAPLGEAEGVPFSLPGELPPEARGCARLTREIDFGGLVGDRATLRFDLITGRGEVFLGDARLAAFEDGPLALDVTDALRRMRRQTLTLRFDDARAAGVFGAAVLRVSRFARLEKVSVLPDAAAGTIAVRARVDAACAGEYALRATLCARGEASPAREIRAALSAGEARMLEWTMDAACERFVPGRAYDAPALRLELVRMEQGIPGGTGAICDEETLLCGLPGDAPRFYLPLARGECAASPEALARRLGEMGVPCVQVPAGSPEILLLALSRAGVAARVCAEGEERERLSRFACAIFAPEEQDECGPDVQEPALSAWRLCGMTALSRKADPALTPAQLLCEAAGRDVWPEEPAVREVLSWLRAVYIRLRAEAMRQGKCEGALCCRGEWAQEDIAQTLRAALAPMHLSALPLYGAWWTTSRFSASLHAFIPEGESGLRAVATLEDEAGKALAQAAFDCPPGGGRRGLLEAALPDTPCVLTLRTRLLRGDAGVEESAIPVYVGERGPLQAAFFPADALAR